jgi:hypothetical protein
MLSVLGAHHAASYHGGARHPSCFYAQRCLCADCMSETQLEVPVASLVCLSANPALLVLAAP